MKKIFIVLLAVLTAAIFAVSASAAINSNHLIDQGYPDFNKDETKWDIFGWTCVDTEITALGYKLDGADTVWVIDRVIVRDDAEKVRENDCFEDLELERAIIEGSLQNGLDEFFGYRMHITLDTSELAKGNHTFEFVVKYADGTEGNPCRETVYDFVKKKSPAAVTETTAEVTTEEITTEEVTTEEVTTEEITTEADTTAEQTTEVVTTEAGTTAEQTTKTPEDTKAEEKSSGGNTAVIIIVIIACIVAAAAVTVAIVLKKKKK